MARKVRPFAILRQVRASRSLPPAAHCVPSVPATPPAIDRGRSGRVRTRFQPDAPLDADNNEFAHRGQHWVRGDARGAGEPRSCRRAKPRGGRLRRVPTLAAVGSPVRRSPPVDRVRAAARTQLLAPPLRQIRAGVGACPPAAVRGDVRDRRDDPQRRARAAAGVPAVPRDPVRAVHDRRRHLPARPPSPAPPSSTRRCSRSEPVSPA